MSEPITPNVPETATEHRDHRRRDRDRRRRPAHGPNSPGAMAAPEPALNLEELTALVNLMSAHGLTDFEVEREGFRVRLRREPVAVAPAVGTALPAPVVAPPAPVAPVVPMVVAAPAAPVTHAPPAPPHPGERAEKAASADEGLHIITSPIVGTFYRAASPTAEPFVKTGSRVAPDSVVCIIEAMKMMNEILAEASGEIAKIYVENAQPVEFGQPLFGVKK